MNVKLYGKSRHWHGEQVSAFVNFHSDCNGIGKVDGAQISLESDGNTQLTNGAIRITLTFAESRLLAHRLLRTIGDRV